jgi:Phospholipase_D-nuclease N-terminal
VWSDLSGTQQKATIAAAVVEVALTAKALADLAGRPGGQVRGPKLLWVLACFVQPVGPIAYLTLGRRAG